jgi:membrane protein
VREFFRRLIHELMNDNIVDVGAMLAYYAILALFPMLVFVVTLAMLILPEPVVMQGVAMATETMPHSARDLISARVGSLMQSAHAGFAIGSALLALWGASRGAAAMSTALNQMYNKRETRSWIRRQLTAIAVTIGVSLIVLLALALLVVGPWIGSELGLGGSFDTLWSVGRWVGAGILVMVIWAVIYKFLPNTRAPFHVFTPGAAIGVMLWLDISWLFGFYLGHFNSYEATYGALGGAIIFLTWLWLSNIALLFGAEINDVLADVRRYRSAAARQLADEDSQAHAA